MSHHTQQLKPAPAPALPACALHQAKGQGALVERLGKNVGTALGLELRDSSQALSPTNSKPVQAGMTFNVAVGACWAACWAACLGWLASWPALCRIHCLPALAHACLTPCPPCSLPPPRRRDWPGARRRRQRCGQAVRGAGGRHGGGQAGGRAARRGHRAGAPRLEGRGLLPEGVWGV